MNKIKVSLSLLLIFGLFGCGNSLVLKPNYTGDLFKKKITSETTNPKIINVIDNRHSDSTNAGIAQIGLFNKEVPYYLNEPVSIFVENSINKFINSDNQKKDVPINVIIDTFKVHEHTFSFSEEGYFDCSFRFYYLVAGDSVNSFAVSSHQVSSAGDVTNSLERLIYQGMKDCSVQFINIYNKNLPKDSLVKPLPNNLVVLSDMKTIQTIDSTNSYSRKKIDNYFGFQYLAGKNIINGVQLNYQSYSPFNDPKFEGGFGYTGTYYDIENKTAFLKGSFVGFGGKYSLRYFVSNSKSALYFSGGLKLTFGNEVVDYGYGDRRNNFYFGPTFDETVGFSIERQIFIEAGLFEIKQFGSVLLPDDIGFVLGLHFKI